MPRRSITCHPWAKASHIAATFYLSNHHHYTHPLPLVLKRRPQSPCPYKKPPYLCRRPFFATHEVQGHYTVMASTMWDRLCWWWGIFLSFSTTPRRRYISPGVGAGPPRPSDDESSRPAPIIIFFRVLEWYESRRTLKIRILINHRYSSSSFSKISGLAKHACIFEQNLV